MDWEKVAIRLAEDYVEQFGCPADANHHCKGLRCHDKEKCPYADVDQSFMAVDCWLKWAMGRVES
jgi:hypothetical protein